MSTGHLFPPPHPKQASGIAGGPQGPGSPEPNSPAGHTDVWRQRPDPPSTRSPSPVMGLPGTHPVERQGGKQGARVLFPQHPPPCEGLLGHAGVLGEGWCRDAGGWGVSHLSPQPLASLTLGFAASLSWGAPSDWGWSQGSFSPGGQGSPLPCKRGPGAVTAAAPAASTRPPRGPHPAGSLAHAPHGPCC